MRIFLITNNIDTKIGLRMVGIDGIIINKEDDFKHELYKAIDDKSIGIILIGEELLKTFSDVIKNVKLNIKFPIIVELPESNITKDKDFLSSYIKQSIGIKI